MSFVMESDLDLISMKESADYVSAAEELQKTYRGSRLERGSIGTSAKYSDSEKRKIAELFQVGDSDRIKGGRTMFNLDHPAYRAVTLILSQAYSFWVSQTKPHPDRSIRRINTANIPGFDDRMEEYVAELDAAVKELDSVWADIVSSEKETLGDLFVAEWYPKSIAGDFCIKWKWPSLLPDENLKQEFPEVYKKAVQEARADIVAGIKMEEDEDAGEIATMADELRNAILGTKDGKPKVFRDKRISNIMEVLDRKEKGGVISTTLTAAMTKLRNVLAGDDIGDQIRKDVLRRSGVASDLGDVTRELVAQMHVRPKRKFKTKITTTNESNGG